MNLKAICLAARGTLLTLALCAAAPSFALPVMDMHIEDLLPMAPDLKATLNLNANQSTLWQQTEARTRAVIHDRQSRRERLQQRTREKLATSNVELRELSAAYDAEVEQSAAEEKQLRELWLTVNDALDEKQRAAIVAFFGEQLERVPDNGNHHDAARPRDDSGGKKRGGRGRPGGAGDGSIPGSGG